MKRQITIKRIKDIVNQWFTLNWRTIFTEKPISYSIEIDSDDYIFIYAEFSGGIKDYCSLGNAYQWLWENNIEG